MENEENVNSKIYELSLEDVLHNSMIPYAEHVIMDRALPRVEDGLKPVQRRILYTMYELGLAPDKPHRKCAKIVGDCLGKFHPHGDTSVYDALVRMAQNFNMRETLVNGHGNFGTVDGDGAAAYRYTEARLEQISFELLRDIDKDTVNFANNFDDTTTEPETLPSRFPNVLVNGAYGIAVGLATNIPTHNLGEVIDGTVAYIDNPKISLASMMKHIKGPDFPTGGFVLAGEELKSAYETGKGKIKLRARVNIEKDGEKRLLVISEIPFQVNKAVLLKSIADLRESKDQKDQLASYIADIVDESDRNGMRAVVKLKKDADPKKVLAYLYKKTQLEITFGINMVVIADGKPQQLGLLDIIGKYVNYQREVILRRSKYDLERAKERAHVLEGLIIAVKNIDEVIRIIKTSDNTAVAKQNLMNRFSITDVQAQAILDLRLSRLTKLEVTKLEEELKELKKTIDELSAIIADRKLQMEVVKREMLEIKKKYKDPRRSLILSADGNSDGEEEAEEPKIVEDMVISFTANNMVKKMTKKNFSNADRSISVNTTKHEVLSFYTETKSDNLVLAVTNKGNCARIDLSLLPENRHRDKGVKFTDIVKEASRDELPVAFFAVDENAVPDKDLLFATVQGTVKRIKLAEIISSKQYYSVMKLADGDRIVTACEFGTMPYLCFVTAEGKALMSKTDDIPVQKAASGGVKGMTLNKGDKVISCEFVSEEGEIVVITSDGYYKRVVSASVDPIARGGKGVKITELSAGASVIFASFVQEPFDVAVYQGMFMFGVNTEQDISIEPRTGKGKQLKNENKKQIPVACYAIK
ncbi:MAG: DNA topoisomerase 4 subunit A [Clostridia bacterium]|nr:DNA topoisomerase 4 subunit A [Clostridia bacterium]